MRIIFKCLFPLLLFVINLSAVSGQSNWELGFRVGEKSGIDATIPLSEAPRLHPSLYVFETYLGAGLYFDWLFNIQDAPQGLKFYPGVGPELYFGPEIEIGAAGNFGAEYSFDFPLTIAIDWRPRILITEKLQWHGENIGVIARFRFGEGVRFVRAN